MSKEPPKFCTGCGRELALVTFTAKYDAVTGEPETRTILQCSRFFLETSFHVQHDSYDIISDSWNEREYIKWAWTK